MKIPQSTRGANVQPRIAVFQQRLKVPSMVARVIHGIVRQPHCEGSADGEDDP